MTSKCFCDICGMEMGDVGWGEKNRILLSIIPRYTLPIDLCLVCFASHGGDLALSIIRDAMKFSQATEKEKDYLKRLVKEVNGE